ncbi:MAG: glycerate kinase, partial [Candidatus Cloacimonetes bacterium]|nr:glycerate kinase [Candidatus Cloacimonadota bacterium]
KAGRIISESVTSPSGNKILTKYAILEENNTAVIEMSAASGLYLVPENKKAPMSATTYGTGELIKSALDKGCRKFIIGLGGSATIDGGAGAVQALGAKLLNAQGKDIKPGGIGLKDLAEIDISHLDKRIKDCAFIVACDVNNPLTGHQGSAFVYGAQKGATTEQIRLLDSNLEHFAWVIKKELGKDIKDLPGVGAAGGLGAGLAAFLNAELKTGVDIIFEITDFSANLEGADLIITGEGKIDDQITYGKTIFGIAKKAAEKNIPVIAIAGEIKNKDKLKNLGIISAFELKTGSITVDESMKNTKKLLFNTSEKIAKLIKEGKIK